MTRAVSQQVTGTVELLDFVLFRLIYHFIPSGLVKCQQFNDADK
jgi:hypothetical protein